MTELLMREAIKKGLEEALEQDPNVLIMGEDIGEYGGAYAVTDGFLAKFGPERIKDTPISEATFIAFFATSSADISVSIKTFAAANA